MSEPARTPVLSLVLGYGAAAPLVAGAAGAWAFDGRLGGLAVYLSVVWGGALLIFLAGVRRGLSFRTEGGPTAAQIAATLWLFLLGVGALVVPSAVAALGLLLAGFASLIVIDPLAAARGEAPPFFASLRPPQMLIPTLSLGALLARAL